MSESHEMNPSQDDFSFSFKSIQKGYAVLAMLLKGKEQIGEALACYRKISGNGVASKEWSSENEAQKLQAAMSDLKRAARFWQSEPNQMDVQHEYASIVRMAYDDCRVPYGIISEAVDVLHRAMSSTGEDAATVRMLAGVSEEELKRSYQTLHKLQHNMGTFLYQLKPIAENGNMVTGGTPEQMSQEMARPMNGSHKNGDFEKEAIFWTVIGILSAERDKILEGLNAVQPPERAEVLKQSFLGVADTIGEYARFGINIPDVAIAKLKTHIPRCMEALTEVKNHINPNDAECIDLLQDNIARLQNGHGTQR